MRNFKSVGSIGLCFLMAACGTKTPSVSSANDTNVGATSILRFKQNQASQGGALSVTPSLYVKSSGAFTAEGGTPPYQYSIAGCDSTINAKTGLVQAASVTSTCQLLVVDSLKASATLKLQIIDLPVTVNPPPAPFPITISETVNAGVQIPITASGGSLPYTYSLSGCDSFVDTLTGVFTAAQDISQCLITVNDSKGASVNETINVIATIQSSNPLTVSSASGSVNASGTLQISANGGDGNYSFTLSGCDSTIDSITGIFTAALDASFCSVVVADSSGLNASTTINVVSQVVVQPIDFTHAKQKIQTGMNRKLEVTGGTAPYTFAVANCDSQIDAASGMFSAGSAKTMCDVSVSDSAGNSAQAKIAVVQQIQAQKN